MIKNILISLILSALLVGCVKPDTRTVIKFSSWGSESEVKILKPVIEEFEKQNPDIKVDFMHIPNNYAQKLHLLVASNLTPDVIFINNYSAPLYFENNVFLNLNPYLKKDNLIKEKDFYSGALKGFRKGNNLYAVPRDISNLVVYYNKDIFDKYHVKYPDENWTYDDFLATAKKLTKDTNNDGRTDVFGVGFEELPLFWMPFLWSNGGDLVDIQTKMVEINKPQSLEGLQFYVDLRNKHHVAPTRAELGSLRNSQMFLNQKIAMQISGRWSVPRYRTDADFDWDIAKFPNGKVGSIVDVDSSGWAISKTSQNPDKAWRLVRFLASKNSIAAFSKDGLIIPARIDVANSNTFLSKGEKPAHSKIFLEAIKTAKTTPANKNFQEIQDVTIEILEPVFNGQKTVKEAFTSDTINKLKTLL